MGSGITKEGLLPNVLILGNQSFDADIERGEILNLER